MFIQFFSPDLTFQVVDADIYTALHRAAYNNHSSVCRWLLSVGANPEFKTETGWTPLHCAACWANPEIVKILIEHNANVNSLSNGNIAPIHLSINSTEDPKRVLETVETLLQVPGNYFWNFNQILTNYSGIDLHVITGAGDTPLMLAKRVSNEMSDLITNALKKR